MASLEDRFRGCLLGLAIGDALGGCFEAQSADFIARRYSTPKSFLDNLPKDELYYTDDTQMAIGVAETLLEHGIILENPLCQAFVENYDPSRGYGRGARAVLGAMEEEADYKQVAESYFPGGSYGNGAAMRVAPVGLFFNGDIKRIWEQARSSAIPTHVHPLGIEGAQVLAVATGLCASAASFNKGKFYTDLLSLPLSGEYREKLLLASEARGADCLTNLGNGIEALESVPTAIACFTTFPDSFLDSIGQAILLGGDTDTIAAMAGALSGAYLGIDAIPQLLLRTLEDTPKGKNFIDDLARKLHLRLNSEKKVGK